MTRLGFKLERNVPAPGHALVLFPPTGSVCCMQRSGGETGGPPAHYIYGSCRATETHAMKLPAHSSYADVNTRGGLDLCSY